jgi:hypothetical protein
MIRYSTAGFNMLSNRYVVLSVLFTLVLSSASAIAEGPASAEDTFSHRIRDVKYVDLQRLQAHVGFKIQVYSKEEARKRREKYAKYEAADIEYDEIHKQLDKTPTSNERSELYRRLSKLDEVRRANGSHGPIYEVLHIGRDYLELRRVDQRTPRVTLIPFDKISEVEFPPELKAEKEPEGTGP